MPYEIRAGRKYCSRECKKVNLIQTKCRQCGKVISHYPSEKPKFCSRKCYHNYGRGAVLEKIKCPQCGCIFTAPVSSKRKFCSVECYHLYQRGKPGIPHTKKTRKKISSSKIRLLMKHPKKIYSSAKRGFRKDLGHYVRSSWEANVCRILNYLNEPYEYEKYSFQISDTSCFLPDLYLPNIGLFIEIKGYMTQGDLKKINKFQQKYLHVPLVLIDGKIYKTLKETYKPFISDWEDYD